MSAVSVGAGLPPVSPPTPLESPPAGVRGALGAVPIAPAALSIPTLDTPPKGPGPSPGPELSAVEHPTAVQKPLAERNAKTGAGLGLMRVRLCRLSCGLRIVPAGYHERSMAGQHDPPPTAV